MTQQQPCLFCQHDDPSLHTVIARNDTCYARYDNYPATLGHFEIVPLRHVESFFGLSERETLDIRELAAKASHVVGELHAPDGYTIGVNEGEAAGRTVPHLHIHFIPRHHGDVQDPRGGVRHVLPGTDADQWDDRLSFDSKT